MRDPEKTIGNIVDKQTVSFLGSVDEEGFPNIKAMLQPRKREESVHFILLPIHLPGVWLSSGRMTVPVFTFATGAFSKV